jgi:hypothetical protein
MKTVEKAPTAIYEHIIKGESHRKLPVHRAKQNMKETSAKRNKEKDKKSVVGDGSKPI